MHIRLGLVPAIVVSSAEAVQLFLKTHDAVFCSRPKIQASELISYGNKGVAFAKYGPYWRHMRKFFTLELLSNAKIEMFKEMRREDVCGVVEEIKGVSEGSDKDFINIVLSLMESNNAHGVQLDLDSIKAILLDMLAAGMDTSATASLWALSELMKHPLALKKAQEELYHVIGLDRMVEETDLVKLEYLNMVIKETMRLHPVAPLLIPRESVEDVIVNDYLIPKKSRLIINAWAIGRDPNVWLGDPEEFNPSRFANSDIDLYGRNFELIPFGAGRRVCPGLQLGLRSIQLVLAQLLHCFNWELPDGASPCDLDMGEEFGLVVSRAKHLFAKSTYRLKLEKL
ncbi:hypothetical protein Sjap_024387 [Stephania japonica]|uniref:Cytochrome P450 n=1 Tax=Stephania japonica TaxID=461633 RepID=A0AAP0EDA9_9MAGN